MHGPNTGGRLWLFSATTALLMFQSFKLRENSSNSAPQRQAADSFQLTFPRFSSIAGSDARALLQGNQLTFSFSLDLLVFGCESMAYTRRNYLLCIEKCHPDPRNHVINHPEFFCNAKTCLRHFLPASSSATDEEYDHTSKMFAMRVRSLYNASKTSTVFENP